MANLSNVTEGFKSFKSFCVQSSSGYFKIKHIKSPQDLFKPSAPSMHVEEDPKSPAPDIAITNNGAPDPMRQKIVIAKNVTFVNDEAVNIDFKSPAPAGLITENLSQAEDTKPPIHTLPHHQPPLYALIIAINDYANPENNLLGAVPDANAMKYYLQNILGVPSNQIKTLFDAQATRDAILKEIRGLADDTRIKRDDPVLIYYAGHGSTEPTPADWKAEDLYIQTIMPQDYREDGVHAIRDRTIGLLINRIAEKKGNNITVIFDCCFSGSATRVEDLKDTHRVRGFELKEAQPDDLDDEFVKDCPDPERITAAAKGFAHAGLRSHILLAACGAAEHAHENEKRGVFTKALLETLYRIDAEKTTYEEIIDRLPEILRQNPQCEGFDRKRILFDSKAPAQGRRLYPVRKEGTQYLIELGAVDGITPGAQFDLYKDIDSLSCTPLASLKVVETNPYGAKLEAISENPPDDIGPSARVLQTRAGPEEDLRLHIVEDENLKVVREAVLNQMNGIGPMQRQISLVGKDEAELEIAFDGGRIVFNILDKRVIEYGLTRIPHWIDPVGSPQSAQKNKVEDIPEIVRGAAHYYWHLRRTAAKEGKRGQLQSKISIELTKLKLIKSSNDENDNDIQSFEPIGKNLIKDNVIDLVSDENAPYGLKITNTLTVPLYVSVFYFDSSDFSIVPYYEPPISTRKSKVDPSIPAEGSLTIGYGTSGACPFRLLVPDEQDKDVGFIKLFLSTEKVDLSNIPCNSPFTSARAMKPLDEVDDRKPLEVWDTIVLTVSLKKASGGIADSK